MDRSTVFCQSRQRKQTGRECLRQLDIQESRSLLLELALYDPNVTSCFNVLTNACLAEDIVLEVGGKSLTKEFKTHLNFYYQSFCVEAVRCVFMYGFVPWYPRKLSTGDVVPSVLPHGTFSWTVKTFDENDARVCVTKKNPGRAPQEKAGKTSTSTSNVQDHSTRSVSGNPGTHKSIDKSNYQSKSGSTDAARTVRNQTYVAERWRNLPIPYNDNASKEVQYVVELLHTSIDPEDVFVHETCQANLHVNRDSSLYATVISPLSHILVDYKNLREAQIRRSHADAWNTTARIFTSCVPPLLQNSEPTNSYLYYETGSELDRISTGRHYMDSRHKELHNQVSQPSNHVPSLYNLPVHHKLEQLPPLNPCEDVDFLLEKFRRDVCSLVGVPYDLVHGKSVGGQETSGRSMLTGRVFGKTILRMCSLLENLIREVYCVIYGEDKMDVSVFLNPMPRLDISSIEDVKTLWEMGAVTPDVVAQLSEILLVSGHSNLTGKFRDTTHKPEEYKQNLVEINKAQKPPNPTANKPIKKKKKKTQGK